MEPLTFPYANRIQQLNSSQDPGHDIGPQHLVLSISALAGRRARRAPVGLHLVQGSSANGPSRGSLNLDFRCCKSSPPCID